MNPLSPEAFVVAATSAAGAQQMALIAAVCAGVTLIIVLIIGAISLWTLFKFDHLVEHTNSIVDRLIKSTAAESHARGDLEGRAALKHEQDAAKKTEEG